MSYSNQKELDVAISKALEKCVNYLSDKMLKCLKDRIWEDTYSKDYYPNKVYVDDGIPTFEFLNAFEFEGIKTRISEVSNKLFYNWMDMSSPSMGRPYVHGNYEKGEDRRSDLASILNVTGKDGNNDFGGKERAPFWDNTIKEINDNFDKWAREAYNLYLK